MGQCHPSLEHGRSSLILKHTHCQCPSPSCGSKGHGHLRARSLDTQTREVEMEDRKSQRKVSPHSADFVHALPALHHSKGQARHSPPVAPTARETPPTTLTPASWALR